MKETSLILGVIFVILTFIGAGYVLYTGGQANAGYAVVPMVFAIAFMLSGRKSTDDDKVSIEKRYFGRGTLSLLLTIIGIVWSFTLFGVCIGDNILNFIGLKAWTNGNTGTHLTVYYSLIFFIPAFLLGVKYKDDWGAKVGKVISVIVAAFLVVATIIFSISGTMYMTNTKANLVNITRLADEQKNGTYIEWNGREYYMFGFNAEPLMDKQIGIVDSDKADRVYAVRDCSTDEWIIEKYISRETDVATLYKEKSVGNIPAGLEKYTFGAPFLTYTQIIENDDRKFVMNSGCGWNFTPKRILLLAGADWSELIRTNLGFEVEQYFDKAIDVMTYDTLPIGIDAKTMNVKQDQWKTYLFVFTGNDLICHKQLESREQFETVKDICNQLIDNNGKAWIN